MAASTSSKAKSTEKTTAASPTKGSLEKTEAVEEKKPDAVPEEPTHDAASDAVPDKKRVHKFSLSKLKSLRKPKKKDREPGRIRKKLVRAKVRYVVLPRKKKAAAMGIIAMLLFTSVFVMWSVLWDSDPIAYEPELQVGDEWLFRSTSGLNLRFHISAEEEHQVFDEHAGVERNITFYKIAADRFNDYGTLAVHEETMMDSATLDLWDFIRYKTPEKVYTKYQFPLYDGKTWDLSGDYTGEDAEEGEQYHLTAFVQYLPGQYYPRLGNTDVFRVSYFWSRDSQPAEYNDPWIVWDYSPEYKMDVEVNVPFLGMHFKYQLIDYCRQDSDGDGAGDLSENYFGSDPFNPDTDGDGANDSIDINPNVDIMYEFMVHEIGSQFNGDLLTGSELSAEVKRDQESIFKGDGAKNTNKLTVEKGGLMDWDDSMFARSVTISIAATEEDPRGSVLVDLHPWDTLYVLAFKINAQATADIRNGIFSGSELPVPGYVKLTFVSNHPSEKVVSDTWGNEDDRAFQMTFDGPGDISYPEGMPTPSFIYGYVPSEHIIEVLQPES